MTSYNYTAQSLALDIKLELIIEDLEEMLEEYDGPPPILPSEDTGLLEASLSPPTSPEGN
jgi:hypothetical protein